MGLFLFSTRPDKGYWHGCRYSLQNLKVFPRTAEAGTRLVLTAERGSRGADTYPGMNRVLQAVGRVIRREEDRGVAVLVDDRYGEAKYRALFPTHWQGVQYAGNPSSLAEIARRFWENEE